jgi:hypoxanthine phosphoribosyltransferase
MAQNRPVPSVILSAEQIAARVGELGEQIAQDYRDRPLVLVPILKGSFLFAADLCRAIKLEDVRLDFLGLRSYGAGTESSGVVQITYDLTAPIADQDVLIVEDIVDTGLSMRYLLDNLATRRPRSVRLCALLHKPARTRVKIGIDYLGFTIEDKFVVGYGLDHDERYRNLPYIGVING